MKLVSFILSFKGVRAILFNLLAITFCHYIIFNLFDISKSPIDSNIFIALFLFVYWIGSNIYFFTGKFKTWIFCNIAIMAPFEVLSLSKWVLTKWHFLAIDAVSKIDVNFLGWAFIYFPVAIFIITLASLTKTEKKEVQTSYRTNQYTRRFFWDNPMSFVLTLLAAFLFVFGIMSANMHRHHHPYVQSRIDNCGC